MKKYVLEIPLQYNRISNLDKPDISSDLDLDFDNEIAHSLSLKMKKGDFTSDEKCIITVNKKNERFMIKIDSLYVDNEEWAIDYGINLANKVCYAITYLAQSQNTNLHYFHPKFTYKIRDIICKEEAYEKYEKFLKQGEESEKMCLTLTDSISFRDTVHMKMSYCIKTHKFDEVLRIMQKNKHFNFIIESYYRALGDGDCISKYYNLFTIIEYIETNFENESGAIKMFNKSQKEDIIQITLQKATEYFKNDEINKSEEYLNRFRNRLSQILSDATDKTRAEKLYIIIKEYFKIDRVNNPVFNYEITELKLKEFINTRNSLFHAKKLNNDELEKIQDLSNQLMVLCNHIISSLMQIDLCTE